MLKLSWLLNPSKFCDVDGIVAGSSADWRAPSCVYPPSSPALGPRASSSPAGSSASGAILFCAISRSVGETSCAVAQRTCGVNAGLAFACMSTAAEPLSTTPAPAPAARSRTTTNTPASLSLRSVNLDSLYTCALPSCQLTPQRPYVDRACGCNRRFRRAIELWVCVWQH